MMYILASPCILSPGLRAAGITTDDDRRIFARVAERCREFNIELVPLPCPETIYFGAGREPGPFVGRMDTPEFSALLKQLEEEVRKYIAGRKEQPLAIVGVNSSPTCGVTTTYYTEEKSAGAGMFLRRFADIPLVDARVFAAYTIYLAAPLFSEGERQFNRLIAEELKTLHYRVHLPQELDDTDECREDNREASIYQQNLAALKAADIIVAVIDGADADSGTAWEMGYAAALGKRVVALRTDFRRLSENESVNLMLETEADVVYSLTGLKELLAV